MATTRSKIKTIGRWLAPPILIETYRCLLGPKQHEREPQPAPLIPQADVPELDLAQLFPGIEHLSVTLPVSEVMRESGMLPLTELLSLAAKSVRLQPTRVFEVGTFRGASTLAIAMHTPADAEIYTLDLPPSHAATVFDIDVGDITGKSFDIGERYLSSPFSGKVRQLFGDSAVFDFGPFRHAIDLVFIDGNHAYENVRVDSENAFEMISERGVIVWDDYDPRHGPGVMQAVNEMHDKGMPIFRVRGTRFAIYQHKC